jgi:hypothetical protein
VSPADVRDAGQKLAAFDEVGGHFGDRRSAGGSTRLFNSMK